MANFMSLPHELQDKVYKYLLTEEVQPTAHKYPHNIPICNSKMMRKEAYKVYLSSNNIIFDNSGTACLWLEHISPYLSTQEEEQPLHLTFDLRHDCNRPAGEKNTQEGDQKRLFHLLGQRTKLDLTLRSGGHFVGDLYRFRAMDLMHGFASATSSPAPAVDGRCAAHRHLQQSSHHPSERKAVANVMSIADRRAIAYEGLLDNFTSACPAVCQHFAGGRTWDSRSTIHLDVRGLKGDPTNCFICFTKGV